MVLLDATYISSSKTYLPFYILEWWLVIFFEITDFPDICGTVMSMSF